MKICVICEAEIVGRKSNAITCCLEHSIEWRRLKNAEYKCRKRSESPEKYRAIERNRRHSKCGTVVKMKSCVVCGSKFLTLNGRSKDFDPAKHRSPSAITCSNECSVVNRKDLCRAWSTRNADIVRQRNRDSYYKHRKKRLEYQALYSKSVNGKAKRDAYAEAHRDTKRAQCRAWRETNKVRARDSKRRYEANNPERVKQWSARNRAKSKAKIAQALSDQQLLQEYIAAKQNELKQLEMKDGPHS